MRVGINCFPLQPQIGGLKQYFLTLLNELLEHDTSNEYVLFCSTSNERELAQLHSDRWRSRAIYLQHWSQISAHLHCIDVYFCPFGSLNPRPLPLPTIVTLADIQEVYYPDFFTPADHYARELNFVGSTYMADRVITISAFSKETLVLHHRLPERKIVSAHLSVDPRYRDAAQVAQPPDHKLPPNFIFYPANFWRHKNHDRLLQALCILRDERNLPVHLVCTGFEQPNGYPLAQKIEAYGLREQVHVLGYCSVEQIAYLYLHARMLVYPSLFEGFGIPLVEAMTVGCPIAAAQVTSIPEVVGDAAVLFDPTVPHAVADAVERIWQDERLRGELIRKGRLRARDFSVVGLAAAHCRAFAEARDAFSYQRYLWNRWFYRYYHRAQVSLHWRNYVAKRIIDRLQMLFAVVE